MKMKKTAIKTLTFSLIQVFLLTQAAWCGILYSVKRQPNSFLSPRINMNTASLETAYLQPGVFPYINDNQIGREIKTAFLRLCGYNPLYAELKALDPAWNPLTPAEEKIITGEIKQILLRGQDVSAQKIQEIVHQQVIDSRMENFRSINNSEYRGVVEEAIKSLENDYGAPGKSVAKVLKKTLMAQKKIYIVDGLPQEIVAHPGKQGIYFGTGNNITVADVIHEANAYCYEISHEENTAFLNTKIVSLMPDRQPAAARDFAMGKARIKLPEWFGYRATASPYEILGINKENASPEEIKKAYRRTAMLYHPDRHNGDKDFEEAFKSVRKAYDTLTNPEEKRKTTAQTVYPDVDINAGIFDDPKSKERERLLAELRLRGLTADVWGKRDISKVLWIGRRIFMSVQDPNSFAGRDAAGRAYYASAKILSFTASQIGHWDFDCFPNVVWEQSPGMLDIFAGPEKECLISNNGAAVLVNLGEENKETVRVDLDEYSEIFAAHKNKLSAAVFPLKGTKGMIAFFDLYPASEAFSKDGNNLVFLTRTGIVINWDIAKGRITQSTLNFPNSQPQYGSFSQYEESFSRGRRREKERVYPRYEPRVALSPNGTLALIWYPNGISEENKTSFAEVWDLGLNKKIAYFPAKFGNIARAKWTDDGNVEIYYESMSGSQLWDWATDTLTDQPEEIKKSTSPNGLYSAKIDEDGSLQITNTVTGSSVNHEVVFSSAVKYNRLNPILPVMPRLNEYVQLAWNANSTQILIELSDKIVIVGLKIEKPEKNLSGNAQVTPAAEGTSFTRLINDHFREQGTVSFADIGSGPVGEFGRNFKKVLSQIKITPDKDSVSIDNSLVDKQAERAGQVKMADIGNAEDRERVGLNPESKDIVFINNIINPDLLRNAVPLLKENGLLMITFALSDQYDSPNMIKNCKALLNEISNKDPEYEYSLLGKEGQVRMPADYPAANQIYPSQDTMLIAEKVRKSGPNTLIEKQPSAEAAFSSKEEWIKNEVLRYHLQADRLGSWWRSYEPAGEDDVLSGVLKKDPVLISDFVARFLDLIKSPYPDARIQERMLRRLIGYIAWFRTEVNTDVLLKSVGVLTKSPKWNPRLSEVLGELTKRIGDNKTTVKELNELVEMILPAKSGSLTGAEALGSPLRMKPWNDIDRTQTNLGRLLAQIVLKNSTLRSKVITRILKLELDAPAVKKALQEIADNDAAILAPYANSLSGQVLTYVLNQCSKQGADVPNADTLKKEHYPDWETVMDLNHWGQRELKVFMRFVGSSYGPGYYALSRVRNDSQRLAGLRFTHDDLVRFLGALHNVPWGERSNHREPEYKDEAIQWIKFLVTKKGVAVEPDDLDRIIDAVNNVDPVLPYERKDIFGTLEQILIRQPELSGQYLGKIEEMKLRGRQGGTGSLFDRNIKELKNIIQGIDIKRTEWGLEQAV